MRQAARNPSSPHRNGENAMVFQSTPHGVEVEVKGRQEDVPVVNVYHVNVGATPTPTDLDNIRDIFSTWMTSTWLPNVHTSYTLDSITAKDIEVEDGPESAIAFTTDNTGAAGGEPSAANAALVISWRTARTGRSFRGRTYLGGLPNAELVDPHNVNPTYAGTVAAIGDALMTALTAAGYTLSVLSRISAGVARVTGLLSEIIQVITDTKVDSQRRRTAN